MKRYLLLMGHVYYPRGWEDFAGAYDTPGEARAVADRRDPDDVEYGWFQIVDLATARVVEASSPVWMTEPPGDTP